MIGNQAAASNGRQILGPLWIDQALVGLSDGGEAGSRQHNKSISWILLVKRFTAARELELECLTKERRREAVVGKLSPRKGEAD